MTESNSIETKDYWTVIALEACGHVVEEITTIDTKDGKGKLLVYHFSSEAAADCDAWARGESRAPFDAIRQVQTSQRRFRANLTRLST